MTKFVIILSTAALCAISTSLSAQPLPKIIRTSDPRHRAVARGRTARPRNAHAAAFYSASLGQPLVLDNRAGAGGVVGSATVAKGAPDGYTWLFTTASHTNTPPFNKDVPFDPVRDFSHVSLVAQNSARRWSCR